MSTPDFERTAKSFRIHTRDGSLWVEDIGGGQDDAWLLVPLGELDALIGALNEARIALAPSSEDTPPREQQWAVRRSDVSLCVHHSPGSVLYTASKIPGGVIVTRMSDETEWRVETDCLCGRSKPIGWHYEACPATPLSVVPTPGGAT